MKRKNRKYAEISPMIAQASEEIVDADVSQFFEMPSFVERPVIHARHADDYAVRLWEEPAQKPMAVKRHFSPEQIESDGSIDLSSVDMSNPREVIGCIYCLSSSRFEVMVVARLDKDFYTHMRQIELEKKMIFRNGKIPSHEEYDMMLEAFARAMSFQGDIPIRSSQTRNAVLLSSLERYILHAVKAATNIAPRDREHAVDIVRNHLLKCPVFISSMLHSITSVYVSSLVDDVFDQFTAAIGHRLKALELLKAEMIRLWPRNYFENVFPRDIPDALIEHFDSLNRFCSTHGVKMNFPMPFDM